MNAAEAAGRVLAALGCRTAFGVVGSGNFHLTNALVAAGTRFVAARHEAGAVTMADAHARLTGSVGLVTVHQGPGLTNTVTGVAEAAKSRTPLIVVAGEATDERSNFHIDQAGLVESVGGLSVRLGSGASVVAEVVDLVRTARTARLPVLFNLPLDVQREEAAFGPEQEARIAQALADGLTLTGPQAASTVDGGAGADELARKLGAAERPVFIAGRGARHARRPLEELADRTGALLATSAVAKGLFRGSPWDLDVSGGFATPLAAELIRGADLVVAWGCALTMWTTAHGKLLPPGAEVIQVDADEAALGRNRPVSAGVVGDVAAVAARVAAELDRPAGGYRSPELAERIAREGRWRCVPYEDESGAGRIDPRTLSIGLDDVLPAERVLATDSGNFMGYPAMFIDVPDERGFCFTQGFQSIGLGLATAIGAALAQPDRLPVAALGDGGALMGIAELETVVRLGLPMVIVVYDDEGYGAEVHHFRGEPMQTVTFPPTDFAALAAGYGCAAVTVTGPDDLAGVAEWVKGARERPLLVHAKVTREHGSWWLEEAFKGH
ncbi:thiamine pyrophosphate-binding protein [Nonomuraea sp. NPDC050310]|uniref:thiamine pyrophosphate-binding protein n=1 Tax=Nonomuraea sp. NPDC050310 TaxID=3154935 RepID=UPI0033C7EBFD